MQCLGVTVQTKDLPIVILKPVVSVIHRTVHGNAMTS